MIPVKTLLCHYDGDFLRLPGDNYECDTLNQAAYVSAGWVVATGQVTPDVPGSELTDPSLAQEEFAAQ